MPVWLAVLVSVVLVVAVLFFVFRKITSVIYLVFGLAVLVGFFLGIGWLASRRDRLPFELPASVDGFLSFVSDPIFFTLDLLEGFFRVF